ncbi:hypothetical protein BDV98DRAFT_601846, partial [Pterulicium gracile]
MSVERLPEDALLGVFHFVLEGETLNAEGSSKAGRERRLPPWNLSATSRKWRVVCLSNAILWTHLRFDNHQCLRYNEKYVAPDWTCANGLGIRRYYLQLDRARDLPIDLNASHEETFNHECWSSMMRLATHRNNPWRSVKFSQSTRIPTDLRDAI